MDVDRRPNEVCHMRLVRRRRSEISRIRRLIKKGQRFTVMHEADDSCCRKESWHQTLASVMEPPKGTVMVLETGRGLWLY